MSLALICVGTAAREVPADGEISSAVTERTISISIREGVYSMSLLKLALFFLVLAAIAAVFGFRWDRPGVRGIAKVLFFVFLVVFAVIGILGMTVFRTVI